MTLPLREACRPYERTDSRCSNEVVPVSYHGCRSKIKVPREQDPVRRRRSAASRKQRPRHDARGLKIREHRPTVDAAGRVATSLAPNATGVVPSVAARGAITARSPAQPGVQLRAPEGGRRPADEARQLQRFVGRRWLRRGIDETGVTVDDAPTRSTTIAAAHSSTASCDRSSLARCRGYPRGVARGEPLRYDAACRTQSRWRSTRT
jgi:hypothetical protein